MKLINICSCKKFHELIYVSQCFGQFISPVEHCYEEINGYVHTSGQRNGVSCKQKDCSQRSCCQELHVIITVIMSP